ncbi:hypothetical protein SAMN06309944_0705 [Micrococcales bacterium KH10]|nr:hypothetical protein SAMN06309944_0705 [Micrococcales bacterium KH10]
MCGILDIGCKTTEAINALGAPLAEQAWDLVRGAFTGRMGSLSASDFQAGADLAGKLIPAMLGATVLLAAWQIVRGMVSLDRMRILKAIGSAILAVPLTLVGIWFAILLTNGLDGFAAQTLTDDGEGFKDLFAFAMGGPALVGIGPFLLFLTIWFLSLVLSVVMMLRNLAIIALIGLAPFALMTFGAEATREWAKTWLQTLIALAVAKPATALLLVLGSYMANNASLSTEGMSSAVTALTVLLLACLTPAAALAFVKFTGTSEAGGIDNAGSQLAGKGRSAMHTAAGAVRRLG